MDVAVKCLDCAGFSTENVNASMRANGFGICPAKLANMPAWRQAATYVSSTYSRQCRDFKRKAGGAA